MADLPSASDLPTNPIVAVVYIVAFLAFTILPAYWAHRAGAKHTNGDHSDDGGGAPSEQLLGKLVAGLEARAREAEAREREAQRRLDEAEQASYAERWALTQQLMAAQQEVLALRAQIAQVIQGGGDVGRP